MSGFVIDASVAMKWFVPEHLSDKADALAASGARLVAPRLLLTELANAFYKKVSARLVSEEHALSDLKIASSFIPEIIDHEPLLTNALTAACALSHPVYDLIYLELAKRMNLVMVTADDRFLAKLRSRDTSIYAVHLADWQLAP